MQSRFTAILIVALLCFTSARYYAQERFHRAAYQQALHNVTPAAATLLNTSNPSVADNVADNNSAYNNFADNKSILRLLSLVLAQSRTPTSSRSTIADADGNYRLVVLSGTNYIVSFFPRTPA